MITATVGEGSGLHRVGILNSMINWTILQRINCVEVGNSESNKVYNLHENGIFPNICSEVSIATYRTGTVQKVLNGILFYSTKNFN